MGRKTTPAPSTPASTTLPPSPLALDKTGARVLIKITAK